MMLLGQVVVCAVLCDAPLLPLPIFQPLKARSCYYPAPRLLLDGCCMRRALGKPASSVLMQCAGQSNNNDGVRHLVSCWTTVDRRGWLTPAQIAQGNVLGPGGRLSRPPVRVRVNDTLW